MLSIRPGRQIAFVSNRRFNYELDIQNARFCPEPGFFLLLCTTEWYSVELILALSTEYHSVVPG